MARVGQRKSPSAGERARPSGPERSRYDASAPEDRIYNRARLNWLLRQIPEVENEEFYIRCHWPKTSPVTQFKLSALRTDPAQIENGKGKLKVFAFDVIMATDLGRRFDQRRNFLDELEKVAPAFYVDVGQHLKAWQAPPPKVIEGREDASKVTPAAIAEDAEVASDEWPTSGGPFS